jgi:hypothetical protein
MLTWEKVIGQGSWRAVTPFGTYHIHTPLGAFEIVVVVRDRANPVPVGRSTLLQRAKELAAHDAAQREFVPRPRTTGTGVHGVVRAPSGAHQHPARGHTIAEEGSRHDHR